MKSIEEIKENDEIQIVEEGFQKMVLAGVGCACTVYVEDLKYTVVAAHYIEVSPY